MENKISIFEKNLTIWVLICMFIGTVIGAYISIIPNTLDKFTYSEISIPIAILIWIIIYPMMLKVDFKSLKNVTKNPKGLFVTWFYNWLIKPFTMFGIAYFFFFVLYKGFLSPEYAQDYLIGAVLLGTAPCTAMVFVWSKLTNGDPAYTVMQVATNDLIILIAFIPIISFLLGITDVPFPMDTLLLSVALFVLIPLVLAFATRYLIINSKGEEYFNDVFIKKFDKSTIAGLLLTLILIFTFQGKTILENPVHVVIIAIPLIIQTFLIFFLAYGTAKVLKLPHSVASPCGMIGASNFFELSVAIAVALFGIDSPVVLATVVGVLVEVPVMLTLVKIANNTKKYFVNK